LLNNKEGECIDVFLPTEASAYYKLKDVEVRLMKDFLVAFYEFHNTGQLLASWWREDKKFLNHASGWYNIVNLQEPYIILMAFICHLYGEKGFSKFYEAWMPLTHTISIFGSTFNWGAIISK
jgi:hypothetical protein